MPPRSAAVKYSTLAFRKALGLPGGQRAAAFFILKSLLIALLAYGLMALLLLQFGLRLESLFGIGLVLGALLWLLSLQARLLSSEVMRALDPPSAEPLPKASAWQLTRLHLASPWFSPHDEAKESLPQADALPMPASAAWQYGLHLLLPFIALRGQTLEGAEDALEILRGKMPLRWDSRQVPVFAHTRLITWAGLILGLALGSLAALNLWLREGSGKLVLLQATALGLGLGLLVALLFLLPAAIASGSYSRDLFEYETSEALAGRPGLLAALELHQQAPAFDASLLTAADQTEHPPQP